MPDAKGTKLAFTEGRDAVNKAAADLVELYSDTEEDKLESIHRNDPNPRRVIAAQKLLIDVMFPGRNSRGLSQAGAVDTYLKNSLTSIWETLQPEIEKAIPFRWTGRAAVMDGAGEPVDAFEESLRVMRELYSTLPQVRSMLMEDAQAAYEGDPAALTFAEVKLAYPGLLAISSHRLAHELYKLNVPIIPRVMSEWTHTQTGVDIHPGAQIGRSFFIDHATGVVIGETADIGNRVKLYQGVTIGAKSFPLDEFGRPIKHIKRHPTVEDEVIVYSNASILGGDTVIGRGSTIGGNVFLTESVPPGSMVRSQAPEPKIKTE